MVTSALMQNNNQKITIDILKKELSKQFGLSETVINNSIQINEDDSWTYMSSKLYYDYTITSDGKIKPSAVPKKGSTINYSVGDNSDWIVLYADFNDVFLIKKETTANKTKLFTSSIDNSFNYSGTNDFKNDNYVRDRFPILKGGYMNTIYKNGLLDTINSSLPNMKATEYLIDSTNWVAYVNEFSDYAIGAPTIELIQKSMSLSTVFTTLKWDNDAYWQGYKLEMDGFSDKEIAYSNNFYWIATPQASGGQNALVSSMGNVISCAVFNNENENQLFYLRPVIHLKFDTIIKKSNNDFDYILVH